MKTVTYKCDRCEKAIDYPKEMAINIAIVRQTEPGEPSAQTYVEVTHRTQWCLQCAEDFRLVSHYKDRIPPLPEPPPTFEDLIREIVREEMQE